MKTLQENLDTVEDCRAKHYENSQETEPESEDMESISVIDIAQVLDIPGCKRLCAIQEIDGYRLLFALPDGTKFSVKIEMEG